LDDGVGSSVNPYVFLAKHMGYGWYFGNIAQTQEQLAVHEHCSTGDIDNNLFELVYEATMSPEEWNKVIQQR
jgi:hypothetical protein